MKILIIGSGGREAAIAWKIRQSPMVDKIYVAPGNGGVRPFASCVPIAQDNIRKLIEFAENTSIDLTIVGPEIPLVRGIVDQFEERGLKIFGPNKKAALLEGSKHFSKEFMKRHNIPTGNFCVCSDYAEARKHVKTFGFPVVIKVSGLAAGKGVSIVNSEVEAEEVLQAIFVKKRFGKSGDSVIIEEFLSGRELSLLCFVDGETILPMESVRDYKRVFDGDEGPNTGGMGAVSPVDDYTPDIQKEFHDKIMLPTLEALKEEEIEYKGVLYFGLILTEKGLRVLEFNCRFGDPEAQVLLPRLRNDLVEVMLSIISGKLDEQRLCWEERNAVCVIMASGGYPGDYERGKRINGLNMKRPDLYAFLAGAEYIGEELYTAGGRVLGITALGKDIDEARKKVYETIEQIEFEGAHYRLDIGK